MKDKLNLLGEALKLVRRSAPGWAAANITLSLLRSILPLVLIWLIKLLIDSITTAAGSGEFSDGIIMLIILAASVYFTDEISADLSNRVRKNQSVRLESYMYNLIHRKSIQLDLINFERPEYFDILSRASREAPWRPNSILNNLISLIRGLASLLLMTGLIFTLNWLIAIILLAVNLPGIFLRLRYSDELYNFRKQQTPEARKSAYFNWLLTGDRPSREIRLFGLGEYFIELFRKSFQKQKEEELSIMRRRSTIEMVSALFKATALLFVLVYIAKRTVAGNISLGEMAMFLLAFRQGMTYIKDVMASVSGLYEDSLFIDDIFAFLNLKENIRAADTVVPSAGLKEKIMLKDVSFTYPGNSSMTLSKVTLGIRKGEIIALTGPNGAGKSTLIRLLCRLYDPDEGVIEIDGTDIRNFVPSEYRKLFSVTFQDFMLYNLTAGENIRLGDTEKNIKGDIIRASESAGIDGLLSSLPEGYDTTIGNLFDNSRELSWGEWQKIALARSLYRDSSVLVLDEPSSAMDADTEYEIFSRFREIVKGRTVILISHRFTNVSLADRIIVLNRGSIAEEGSHEELMSRRGMYYNMFTRQSSR